MDAESQQNVLGIAGALLYAVVTGYVGIAYLDGFLRTVALGMAVVGAVVVYGVMRVVDPKPA